MDVLVPSKVMVLWLGKEDHVSCSSTALYYQKQNVHMCAEYIEMHDLEEGEYVKDSISGKRDILGKGCVSYRMDLSQSNR